MLKQTLDAKTAEGIVPRYISGARNKLLTLFSETEAYIPLFTGSTDTYSFARKWPDGRVGDYTNYVKNRTILMHRADFLGEYLQPDGDYGRPVSFFRLQSPLKVPIGKPIEIVQVIAPKRSEDDTNTFGAIGITLPKEVSMKTFLEKAGRTIVEQNLLIGGQTLEEILKKGTGMNDFELQLSIQQHHRFVIRQKDPISILEASTKDVRKLIRESIHFSARFPHVMRPIIREDRE